MPREPLNHTGRYQVEIVDTNCECVKENSPRIGIIFLATAFWGKVKGSAEDAEPIWIPVKDSWGWGREITGYFYTRKKDGERGDFAINALMKILPEWDGNDLDVWNTDEFHAKPAQITVTKESYEKNGQTQESLKVTFVNPFDFQPGFQKPTVKLGNLSDILQKAPTIAAPVNPNNKFMDLENEPPF